MHKMMIGALSAVVLLVALPAAAQNKPHAGAHMYLGTPDYERTLTGSDESMLAHTKSAEKHTICASRHNTDHAIIHYDGNETTIDPGHCVLVEASYVTANPAPNTSATVYGWHHPARRHGRS